ncbi:MAG: thioredoxin family protein [Massilia sp.]
MSSHRIRWLAAALLSATGLCAHGAATDGADRFRTDQVQVRLLSESASVAPGQTVQLGVQQIIIPHWHTYWKNPGDSGTSTTITWKLPPGVSASEIVWPAPQRFVLGPITNYGYDKEVVLLTRLTVPASQPVGSALPIEAQVNWLVCEESCIPQQATLKLSLPVTSAAAPADALHEVQRRLIASARQAIPADVAWPATYRRDGDKLLARIELPAQLGGKSIASMVNDNALWFYPSAWGTIAHNAAQSFKLDGRTLQLTLAPGETPPAAGSAVHGVLVVQRKSADGSRGDIVHAVELGAAAIGPAESVASNAMPAPVPAQQAVAAPAQPATDEPDLTLWSALLFAFLGGVVLNLMPCVFPVLSIKALALLKHSELSAAQKRWQGVAYTAGVVASFTLLALALIAIKQLGGPVGWGFQFQSPYFVLGVAYLIFIVGLNLSGVFEVGGGAANLGAGLAARPGYSGSFFTGVLATVVATPCTAPFMGAALGFALAQPPLALWLVFLALGLGLALPYLAVSAWPALHRALPRPGLWMERIKQALAFPMYGAAVWLVWVLAQQAGVNAIPLALGGMVALALALWLFDSTRNAAGARRLLANGAVAACVLATLGASFQGIKALDEAADTGVTKAGGAAVADGGAASRLWQPYQPATLAALRAQGKPVFVNLTAAWCITCLVNERVALSRPAFRTLLADEGIAYLKGDWTNQDAQIGALLKQFGRSGVPLYVFYPPGAQSKAVVLPQILTQDIVSSALRAN